MSPIAISINLTKVPEGTTFQGKKGEYLNLVLLENRDGTDQYGNDGFAKIEVSKADREAGKRGEIVGNWKFIGKSEGPLRREAPPRTAQMPRDEVDDIPF